MAAPLSNTDFYENFYYRVTTLLCRLVTRKGLFLKTAGVHFMIRTLIQFFPIEQGIFARCAATKRYVASNALRMVVILR